MGPGTHYGRKVTKHNNVRMPDRNGRKVTEHDNVEAQFLFYSWPQSAIGLYCHAQTK